MRYETLQVENLRLNSKFQSVLGVQICNKRMRSESQGVLDLHGSVDPGKEL